MELSSVEVSLHAEESLVDQCGVGFLLSGEVVHGESAGVGLVERASAHREQGCRHRCRQQDIFDFGFHIYCPPLIRM